MSITFIDYLGRYSRKAIVFLSIVLALTIGVFDYLTGTDVSLAAFYLGPVALAAWFLGARSGTLIALFCVAVWATSGALVGDEDFQIGAFDLWWNGALQLVAYLALVWTLSSLHRLQRSLEQRIRDRAIVLTRELAERERLQRELLEASEREQQRIGQDLHDGLGQHLVATALAGQVMYEKLLSKQLAESVDASRLVALLEQGIVLSREVARGFYPLESAPEGLMNALTELTATSSTLYKIDCRFQCSSPVLVYNQDKAAHLYKIAQEALRNAIRHGKCRRVTIRLATLTVGQLLAVDDDGIGMRASELPITKGMGLRIMAYRSKLIGGSLEVRPLETGGTSLVCVFPACVPCTAINS